MEGRGTVQQQHYYQMDGTYWKWMKFLNCLTCHPVLSSLPLIPAAKQCFIELTSSKI